MQKMDLLNISFNSWGGGGLAFYKGYYISRVNNSESKYGNIIKILNCNDVGLFITIDNQQ